jgi:hypothetical protein
VKIYSDKEAGGETAANGVNSCPAIARA